MSQTPEAARPRSVRKELEKVAVGRPFLRALPKDTDFLNEVLDTHEASYATERSGLLYLSEATLARYAGKAILGKSQLLETIDRLGSSAQSILNIRRGVVRLFPIHPDSVSADYYKVTALMLRASDGRGTTREPYFEKNRLHNYLGMPPTDPTIPILFGRLRLSAGSPDVPALEDFFNDVYPKAFQVAGVQLLDQR